MTLRALQTRFHAGVLAGRHDAEDVTERSQRGVRVYAHAYRSTLLACLRDTYERTHAWLGDAAFDTAAAAFAADTPSRSWTLSDYGDGFPERLAALHLDDPEVAELAWLDRALRRAFDGADADPVDPASLAEVDWEAARLTLHPTLVMRPIATNAPALWSAMSEGETPPPAELLPEPMGLRVWRQGLAPTFRTIAPLEARAIAAVQAGETFGGVCAALAEDVGEDDAAEAAGAFLGVWLADALLVGVG